MSSSSPGPAHTQSNIPIKSNRFVFEEELVFLFVVVNVNVPDELN